MNFAQISPLTPRRSEAASEGIFFAIHPRENACEHGPALVLTGSIQPVPSMDGDRDRESINASSESRVLVSTSYEGKSSNAGAIARSPFEPVLTWSASVSVAASSRFSARLPQNCPRVEIVESPSPTLELALEERGL